MHHLVKKGRQKAQGKWEEGRYGGWTGNLTPTKFYRKKRKSRKKKKGDRPCESRGFWSPTWGQKKM